MGSQFLEPLIGEQRPCLIGFRPRMGSQFLEQDLKPWMAERKRSFRPRMGSQFLEHGFAVFLGQR